MPYTAHKNVCDLAVSERSCLITQKFTYCKKPFVKIHLAGWYFAASLRGEKLLRGITSIRKQLQQKEEGPGLKQAAPSRGVGPRQQQVPASPLAAVILHFPGNDQPHPATWGCLLVSLLIKRCFLFLLIKLLDTTSLSAGWRSGRGTWGEQPHFLLGRRKPVGQAGGR